jgi:DNA-binding PadR family transcriptional regulator
VKKRRKTADGPDAFLPLKPAVFHILLALSERDLHGYGIMKAVEEGTDGRIRIDPSPLYRRLKRLVEQGIVKQVDERRFSDSDDERRRYYGLTELGQRVLAGEAARVVELSRSSTVRALAAKAE